MTDGSDSRTPSRWMRILGSIGAAYVVMYGAIGLLHNDLHVALSKSDHAGLHLHGALAWICYAGMPLMSIGMIRLLGPQFGDAEFEFPARRRRFGPMVLLGRVWYVVSQVIANQRS